MKKNKTYVGIIGPNEDKCTKEIYQFAFELGKVLAERNLNIVTGGKLGIMEAVCKGAKSCTTDNRSLTIGILPDEKKSEGNNYCDVIIPTGIGTARNKILINTADIIIAIAGGAGTLSEIAFAWQMNKPVIAYTGFAGWAKNLAGKSIDSNFEGSLYKANTHKEILSILDDLISDEYRNKKIPETK